jgi:hypothetical protein
MAKDGSKVLTGGCQCGAVRFAVAPPLGEASVCYCRMCQKATGGPFGLFVRVDESRFRWTRGEPRRFASSNVARRGFCAACGTPLTWEYDAGFDLTVAAFDNARDIEPTIQMSLDTRYPWLLGINDLPVRSVTSDPEYAEYLKSVVSYQHPDHDTARWPPQDRNE